MKSPLKKKRVRNPFEELQADTKKVVRSIFTLTDEALEDISFRAPPPHITGDYSFSTFSLSQYLKQEAVSVAEKIIKSFPVASEFVEQIYALGPYVNTEVAKEPYNEQAIQHILTKKKEFGGTANRSSRVLINYFVSDTISTCNESRLALLGAVIGRCCTLSGRKVVHQDYTASRTHGTKKEQQRTTRSLKRIYSLAGTPIDGYAAGEDFSDTATKVIIRDALKSGVAESVGETRVVITAAESNLASVVLRRQDGSITSSARHLAYIKSVAKYKPTSIIFLCPQRDMNMLDTSLSLAKRMKLLPSHIKLSMVSIPLSEKGSPFFPTDATHKYVMLRTAFHKRLQSDDPGSVQYRQINKELEKLRQGKGKQRLNSKERFQVTRLLLDFPKVVTQVVTTHDPSVICMYLEQLSQLSEKLRANRDVPLARATSVVLQNGLNLLVS